MESVMSAIASDLVNRFMSFLIKKYRSRENPEEKMERLQHLLLRIRMVVEEAECRHITNSKMLLQLKKLAKAMYRGYYVLDTAKYRSLRISEVEEEVRSSRTMPLTGSMNCCRSTRNTDTVHHDLQSTLDNLETLASNMTEFVLLLGGCERMFHRPYDTYLYIDNFMFGRQIEKQQVINILLQDSPAPSVPTVLPIIGASRVGKKTLVAHVCNNQKVLSRFPSILHLNGENICEIEHRVAIPAGRTLIVVEFTSDVDDETWRKFYSSAAQMGRGSKIIIISKIQKLTRFGTVKPVCLNSLSPEEYSYLFKVLAFGSTDPEEHPRLISIAEDMATVLGGSLVTANVYADVLRRDQNANFWLRVLNKYRNMVKSNLTVFGEHPKYLMDRYHPVDISNLASSSTPLHLMPPHSENDGSKKSLPKVMLGDMIADSAVLPKEEYELVSGESRIPPYKRFVNVAKFSDEMNFSQPTVSPSKKCRRLDQKK